MSKVTVVGAGNVGATCANVIATREIADELVLLDIKEGVSEGKMLDIFQTATLMDFDTKLTGVTNDYAATADSDVVVVTSGMPRKPGMTREELIGVNAGIVASVVGNVLKYSPKAVILMISNPMDTMTYLALKKSGLPKNQIFGMGGALDSARFKCYLSKALKANSNEIEGMVIGGHGDTTMIPLYSKATYKGIPVTELLSKEEVEKVVADTMVGGATLTKLLGTSAWYAPGAAAAYVVESIIRDQKKVVPSCTYLEGEYGQNDICIGVPAIIGRKGIEKIVKIELTKEEEAKFAESAAAVRKTGMTPAVLTDHEDKVAFDFFQAKLQAKSMASIDRELATKETELLKGKKVGYVFIDAKTLLESVKSGNVTNAAQFFQIHAPRTLRTTEILLDEQGVAVSFRAPMAVQDETGKSMLEEKKSK